MRVKIAISAIILLVVANIASRLGDRPASVAVVDVPIITNQLEITALNFDNSERIISTELGRDIFSVETPPTDLTPMISQPAQTPAPSERATIDKFAGLKANVKLRGIYRTTSGYHAILETRGTQEV